MSENPLLPFVLQALRSAAGALSEYELLRQIEAAGAGFDCAPADANLALFRKHFLLMNALYHLQQSLWDEERLHLHISPLRIALEPRASAIAGGLALAVDTGLRDYYLDWQQLAATDSTTVTDMLAGFWQRFHAVDERAAALAVLQLDAAADWPSIKRQYRRLAAGAHPDRGGDAAQFLAIRAAYEQLREADGY